MSTVTNYSPEETEAIKEAAYAEVKAAEEERASRPESIRLTEAVREYLPEATRIGSWAVRAEELSEGWPALENTSAVFKVGDDDDNRITIILDNSEEPPIEAAMKVAEEYEMAVAIAPDPKGNGTLVVFGGCAHESAFVEAVLGLMDYSGSVSIDTRSTWESADGVTVPPGEYFLGDPGYAVGSHEDWMHLLNSCNFFQDGPVGELPDGTKVLAFPTAYGDGLYFDDNEDEVNRYPVEAGLIGLVPVSPASEAALADHSGKGYNGPLMNRVQFDEPAFCANKNGRMDFGDYRIDTR
jgi:hypothetical protein